MGPHRYSLLRFFIDYTTLAEALHLSLTTDPENTDYAAEAGAYRTFQAEAIAVREIERKQQEKEEEEANNPMLALENRTKESRREMDILDVLEEIKDINAQQEG
uniref:Uncharacterized protein n=1 Tax=Amphimedon queenslandica TaxID=400682 RepID=A0A1X7TCT2_AMPQE